MSWGEERGEREPESCKWNSQFSVRNKICFFLSLNKGEEIEMKNVQWYYVAP